MSDNILEDARFLDVYGLNIKKIKYFIALSDSNFDTLSDSTIDEVVEMSKKVFIRDAILAAICYMDEKDLEKFELLLLNIYQNRSSDTAFIAIMLSMIYCLKNETFLARRWINLALAQDEENFFANLIVGVFDQSISTGEIRNLLIAPLGGF
jgi:hypothetical protein